jgi:regulator of sigma E protease
MVVLNVIYVVVAVLLLFGAAVFVHEYGHYWMAKRRGLKIEEFAIGFGPKVFSWMHDGVVWSWRWIPAGGFVKLPQMVTSDALEGKAAEDAEKLPAISPWSKILVAFAGPLMNVVFAFVIAGLIFFVGLPVAVNPSVIGHVEEDSEEYALGIREGDLIVRVDDQMVKSWQDVQLLTALARTNVLEVVIERDGARNAYHLKARVNEVLGLKMLDLYPRDHPVVAMVQADSPAEKAGLKENDRFISFGGVPVVGQQQLVDLIQKRGGEPTEVIIQRGEQTLTFSVTPAIIDPEKKTGRIGAMLTSDSTIVYRVMKPGPKPWELVGDVWDKTVRTFSALIYHKQTGVGAKDLSGPVGILAMLAAWVNTDYRLALNFLVLLNVNLAILNLLPIPVLDGGHILLAMVEKVRRRPISGKLIEYTTAAFAVLLISFMLYVTFFDIRRFSLFKAMFSKDVQIEQADAPAKPTPAPAK